MADSHVEVTRRHRVYDTADGQVEEVATDKAYRQPAQTAVNIVTLIASVIGGMLAIRFILSLLGANQASAFGSFVYAVTEPLVMPFYGLFGTKMIYGQSRLELETIVAIIVYALIAWAIVKVLLIDRRNNTTTE